MKKSSGLPVITVRTRAAYAIPRGAGRGCLYPRAPGQHRGCRPELPQRDASGPQGPAAARLGDVGSWAHPCCQDGHFPQPRRPRPAPACPCALPAPAGRGPVGHSLRSQEWKVLRSTWMNTVSGDSGSRPFLLKILGLCRWGQSPAQPPNSGLVSDNAGRLSSSEPQFCS